MSGFALLADLPELISESEPDPETDEDSSEYETDHEGETAAESEHAHAATASGLSKGFFKSPAHNESTSRAAGASNTGRAGSSSSSRAAGSSSSSAGLRTGFFSSPSSKPSSSSSSSSSQTVAGGQQASAGSSSSGASASLRGSTAAGGSAAPPQAALRSGSGSLRTGFFDKPKQQQQQQQQQQPPLPPPPQQQQQQQAQPQRLHPQQQQQQQQQRMAPPAQQQQQRQQHAKAVEQGPWVALFRVYLKGCYFALPAGDGPCQATVDAAHDLLQLLAEHPQLEALAADDRQLLQWRDTFVLRYREEATWLPQYPASRINWSDWMRQLLWNVLISGTPVDIDGLCELVEELHCQKDNWMMLSVPNKNDGWFVRPGMPSELQAMPGHANIWEVLIRHQRWPMLLEGIKQWPAIFEDYITPSKSPGLYVDGSPLCVLLQQLLYADAPVHVMSEVFSHVTKYTVAGLSDSGIKPGRSFMRHFPGACYSLQLWFAPPALMAEQGALDTHQREDVKRSKLPDLLSAAVAMNTGGSKLPVIKAVLCHMAWPGMLVDPARASAQTRQGWWFECSAVWSAVKRGDEEVLKLLLASIASGGEMPRGAHSAHSPLRNHKFVPAARYNVDMTCEGVVPLMLAICAGNINQAKMLLAAGADPLAVCSTAGGSSSSSSSATAGNEWSTPLHEAVEKNQVKLLQHLAPKLAATPAVTHPKPFGRHKQGSIWNSAGHTPLTLACSLRHDKAACAMLAAGFSPLQLARVLLPGAGKEQEVHALLLAAQAAAASEHAMKD